MVESFYSTYVVILDGIQGKEENSILGQYSYVEISLGIF